MMRAFTPGELTRMRATQDGAMMDTCLILAYSEGAQDEYGKTRPTYTAGAATRCGFDGAKHDEAMDEAEVEVADGQLRLPLGTAVGHKDRIKITNRYGEALATPPIYDTIGEPAKGPSGLVLNLKLVTDGS